jgi:hypothetical protein
MPKYLIEREIQGAGKLSAKELQGNIAEIMFRAAENGTTNPVGGELRDRRQGLLRLCCAQRGYDPRACQAGRLSGQQDFGN